MRHDYQRRIEEALMQEAISKTMTKRSEARTRRWARMRAADELRWVANCLILDMAEQHPDLEWIDVWYDHKARLWTAILYRGYRQIASAIHSHTRAGVAGVTVESFWDRQRD